MSLSCFLLPYVASLSPFLPFPFFMVLTPSPHHGMNRFWFHLSLLNSIDLCSLLFLSCLGSTLLSFYFSVWKHAYRVQIKSRMFIQILLSLQCYLGTRVLRCASVTSIQVRGLLCYAFHLSIGHLYAIQNGDFVHKALLVIHGLWVYL